MAKKEEDLMIREHLLAFNGLAAFFACWVAEFSLGTVIVRKAKGSPDRLLKSRSMPEITISSPFGFRHVAHVGRTGSEGFGFGLDVDFADLEPDWMLVAQKAGISQKQLNDSEWLKFIIDFTLKNSDPKEIVGGRLAFLLFFFQIEF